MQPYAAEIRPEAEPLQAYLEMTLKELKKSN